MKIFRRVRKRELARLNLHKKNELGWQLMSTFTILRYPPKQIRCIQFYGLKFPVCIMQKKIFILTVLLTGLSTLLYGQLAVSPATLPDGTYGSPYNQQLTTTGGTAPYSYSILFLSGSLPPGVSMDG